MLPQAALANTGVKINAMASSNFSANDSQVFCMTITATVLPWLYHMSFAAVYALLSVMTIASNTTLIYALHKTKQLNSISNKFILVMNISDLCLGVIGLPAQFCHHMLRQNLKNCALSKFISYWNLTFGFLSFMMLSCISIDRYFHVTKLNRYNLFMNSFRMKIMIILSVIVANIVAYTSLLQPSFIQQVISVAGGSFGLIFAMNLYKFLLRRLRNHVESQVVTTTANDDSNEPQRTRSKQLSAIRTIQFLLVYLAITYIPYVIMSCWWTYWKFLMKIEPGFYVSVIYECSAILAFFNAFGNSWIIIYGNSKSRRFIVSSLFGRYQVENSNEH